MNKYKDIPAASLGITIAVGMTVFIFIGNWVGERIGNQHVWVLLGMFCGLFYGGYEVWKLIRKNSQNS